MNIDLVSYALNEKLSSIGKFKLVSKYFLFGIKISLLFQLVKVSITIRIQNLYCLVKIGFLKMF